MKEAIKLTHNYFDVKKCKMYPLKGGCYKSEAKTKTYFCVH